MHPILKRILGQRELLLQMLISICVRVLGAFSVFVLSVFVGRELGAESAGYFFLAFSVVTFLAALSRMGFDNTLVRFIGSGLVDAEWANIRTTLNRALLLAGGLSSVFAVILFVGSGFIANVIFTKPLLAPVLQAMAPGVVGLSLFTLLAMALQGLHKVAPSVFVINISANVWVVIALLVFHLETPVSVATAYSVATGITVLLGCGFWLYFAKPAQDQPTIQWSTLFASSMPLWIVMLMSQLTQWSGQFIAGVYVPSEEVAQLAVAQRTAMLTSFILMAVNLVVAPRFAALYKQGNMEGLERLALMSVKLMVLFAIPIVAVMMFFPSFLMKLFGEGFAEGGHLLQILAVGQFVNVVTGSVGYLLSMSGHEKDLRNTVLISGPLAIIAAVALTPLWGATGSAIATALAVATQNLVAVFWVRKRLGFNTLAVWR
ncbi:flippase [Neptunomonas phycophila]|uniref:flippase n=1 Tax=Neptunomonas phycophila TaxID=1572645 RepID=UPI0015B7D7EA|nr:flippase [Neptunomonas phycophila]QLE96965.1 flippase [Neptunomonas phycophila]